MVNYRISGEAILVTVPYGLKDNFKSFFRTAKWNPVSKAWEVKNTKANLNKLEQFQDSIISSGADEAVKNLDEAEATEAELVKLLEELKQTKEKISLKVSVLMDEQKLAERLSATKTKLTNAVAELSKTKRELEEARASNREALQEVLSQYSLEGMTINQVIKAASRAHSGVGQKNRDEFNHYTSWLWNVAEEILKKTGIRFKVLFECGNANFNRPDRDNHWFSKDVMEARYVCVNNNNKEKKNEKVPENLQGTCEVQTFHSPPQKCR